MAGFAQRTGIDGRLVPLVLLSTLIASGLFTVLAFVMPRLAWDAPPAPVSPVAAFPLVLLGAVLVLPVTLPAALGSWVLAWHLGWRRGWTRQGRALVAGASAGAGAVSGLVVVDAAVGGLAGPPHAIPPVLLAAVTAGAAAAYALYGDHSRRGAGEQA